MYYTILVFKPEMLINLNTGIGFMRRSFAIIKAIFDGKASIDYVEKTRISKAPGDVTELIHN